MHLFRTLAVVAVGSLVLGQASPDVKNGGFGPKNKVTWDAVTTDILGQPETISGYRIYAYRDTVDPRVTGVAGYVWMKEVSGTLVETPLTECIDALKAAGIAEKTKIRFFVTAVDSAGNESGFSNMWEGFLDSTQPNPPGHAGCALLK